MSFPKTPLADAARQFKNQLPPPLGSNVVLIVIDTLRADRLGSYGYTKNTSPNIDKLARQGTLFHRFYAAAPWTAPSFGTIFTGVSPSVHMGGKVLDHTDSAKEQENAQKLRGFSLYPIVEKAKTLAELLQCCVDISGAIVNNPFLHPSLGYDRGFSTYDYTVDNRPAVEITDAAVKWLGRRQNEQFMLLVHYMDAHTPYAPSNKYKSEFFPMDSGRLSLPINQKIRDLKKMNLTSTELAFIKGVYDAQIKEVDTQIGRVIDQLSKSKQLDNTWIIVTSDHGEEHFEHGSFFHGMQYEDEVTRVPLIIRAPGGKWGAGNQVVYSAGHQDILPTILEWYDIPVPKWVEGKSLVPMMTGEDKTDRVCLMENSMLRDDPKSDIEKRYRKRALFDGRYKVIQSFDGIDTRVYDLDLDPLEQAPLPPAHPAFFKSMRSLHTHVHNQTQRIESMADNTQAQPLPSDVTQSLKNLGYVE